MTGEIIYLIRLKKHYEYTERKECRVTSINFDSTGVKHQAGIKIRNRYYVYVGRYNIIERNVLGVAIPFVCVTDAEGNLEELIILKYRIYT